MSDSRDSNHFVYLTQNNYTYCDNRTGKLVVGKEPLLFYSYQDKDGWFQLLALESDGFSVYKDPGILRLGGNTRGEICKVFLRISYPDGTIVQYTSRALPHEGRMLMTEEEEEQFQTNPEKYLSQSIKSTDVVQFFKNLPIETRSAHPMLPVYK